MSYALYSFDMQIKNAQWMLSLFQLCYTVDVGN